MKHHLCSIRYAASCFVLLASVFAPTRASAHCDGLDGPVVAAARQALQAGDVKRVFVWVQKEDEPEIALAFSRAMAVRRLGAEAKALADQYFFETLVRIHRAGEGAAYTGLQPAGRDLGPAIPAADRALDTGDPRAISALLGEAMNAGLSDRFLRALEAKRHAGDDVEAGRSYVSTYVQYVHFVEDLYQAATRATRGHFEDAPKQPTHAH
jgi:hypothetical protein